MSDLQLLKMKPSARSHHPYLMSVQKYSSKHKYLRCHGKLNCVPRGTEFALGGRDRSTVVCFLLRMFLTAVQCAANEWSAKWSCRVHGPSINSPINAMAITEISISACYCFIWIFMTSKNLLNFIFDQQINFRQQLSPEVLDNGFSF